MGIFRIEAGGIFVESTVYSAGGEDNKTLLRCHDGYEMLYVISGSGKCTVEGIDVPMTPRTLMIFPPLVYHTVNIDGDADFEVMVLRFYDSAALEVADGLAETLVGERFGSLTLNSAPLADSIASVIERFESVQILPSEEMGKMMRLYLSELLLLISTVSKDRGTCDDSSLGVRVMKYLNENMDIYVSLDRLAKRFFVSKYYLCRAFKQQNGVSVHGYITRKRVMRAKQLIDSGEPAARAAEKVGFGDYSAFYRAYVKLIGRSPTFDKYTLNR